MAYAQPRAIGLRLGAFDGISYQHAVGDNNMFEIEAGFGWMGRAERWWHDSGASYHGRWYGHNVQLAFTYDWIDPFGATFPWEHKGEWHWYMGVGAAGGYGWYAYGYAPGYGWVGGNGNWGFGAAAGRVGVEYDFWFPLQISIDWRPTLGAALMDDGMGGVGAGLYWEVTSLALGVRYKF